MTPSLRLAAPLAACFIALLTHSYTALAADRDPTPMAQWIKMGKEAFSHETFAGNGRVCETCHLQGGMVPGQRPDGAPIPSLANAAAIYPRFNGRQGKVITLQDQIRGCAGNALEGTPPAYGSDTLNALTVYLTSLAQGKPLDMGGKPQ